MRITLKKNANDDTMLDIITHTTTGKKPIVWATVLDEMIEDDIILRTLKAFSEWEGELKDDDE